MGDADVSEFDVVGLDGLFLELPMPLAIRAVVRLDDVRELIIVGVVVRELLELLCIVLPFSDGADVDGRLAVDVEDCGVSEVVSSSIEYSPIKVTTVGVPLAHRWK